MYPLSQPLPAEFYRREEVLTVARELLGQRLCVKIPDSQDRIAGLIVETEAYDGIRDRACHAFLNRRTARNETMYRAGGCAYVFVTYGIHCMFNVVTGVAGNGQVVLIRAVEPVEGMDLIKLIRPNDRYPAAGPGKLTQVFGLNVKDNGADLLTGERIFIEKTDIEYSDEQIIASPRVGISYAREDTILPYRFRVKDHPHVSKAK